MPTSPHRALYTVDQVRALERGALDAMAVSNHELMLRAAHAAFDSLRRHWPQAARIAIHCGPGNNGGDGFLLGVLAREAGLQVDVVALIESSRGEAMQARAAWKAAGGRVRLWDDTEALPRVDMHVDAMYGIGLNRAPDVAAAALIEAINASATPVLALDLPSGLSADSGDCPGAVIRADVTVTFIAHKRGLHTGRAVDQVGTLELATLGVPDSVYAPLQPDALLARQVADGAGEEVAAGPRDVHDSRIHLHVLVACRAVDRVVVLASEPVVPDTRGMRHGRVDDAARLVGHGLLPNSRFALRGTKVAAPIPGIVPAEQAPGRRGIPGRRANGSGSTSGRIKGEPRIPVSDDRLNGVRPGSGVSGLLGAVHDEMAPALRVSQVCDGRHASRVPSAAYQVW